MISDNIYSSWRSSNMILMSSIVILLVIATCGAVYRARIINAKSYKNKLKKIAKSAHLDIKLCKENEKEILKIKKQLEKFTHRVAFNLLSVDWILTQQLDLSDKINRTDFKLEKIRELRRRKSPTMTYVTGQPRETLI